MPVNPELELTLGSPARSGERAAQGVLAAVCLAALMLPLTFVGVAVATPAIGRELGGSPLELSWTTNAFMLSFGSVLMAAGTLADEFGRKRLFSLGVALFALTSLALVFAPSLLWLNLLRGVQGWPARLPWPAVRRPWPRRSMARAGPVPSVCWAPPSGSAWPSGRSWPGC